jgi:hypothetical protein
MKYCTFNLCTVIAMFAATVFGQSASLRFEVTEAAGLTPGTQNGRLFVFINKKNEREPRLADGEVSNDAPPILARDVKNFGAGSVGVIDNASIAFPIADLAHLPTGEYYVQALLDTNVDLRSLNAPGNLYSSVQKVTLDPAGGGTVKLAERVAALIEPSQRGVEIAAHVVRTTADYSNDPNVLYAAKRQIIDEILGLDQSPRLLVQTTPVEYSRVADGASIDVHGWVEPGTRITINGTDIPVADDGLFLENIPLSSRRAITIEARRQNAKKQAVRHFLPLPEPMHN